MTATALQSAQGLLGGERFPRCESPSLRLEKFVRIGKTLKGEEIAAVVDCQRRYGKPIPKICPAGATSFKAKLEGNLIVNQAGGILENAGMCLHPHFGAPYIPGSAVKGVARHAAWCEWNAETDASRKLQIAKDIATIFGYPTGDDGLDEYLKKAAHFAKDTSQSGSVCFFAAVPETNADLLVDILTPHGGNDWTEPVPSQFPAVKKGATFVFALASTRGRDKSLCDKAVRYLKVGLTVHGIGAKTCAGYGSFSVEGAVVVTPRRTYKLALASPAFFRGADSDSEGLLRESSLRGLMRWWWRYLYRSLYAENELKKLEAYIWGGSGTPPAASKVRVRLVKSPDARGARAMPYSKDQKAGMLPRDFKQLRTTGLAYLSYGMDEKKVNRKVLEPSASTIWEIEVSVRYTGDGISPDQVLEHAELALLALCTFGGVGAKARKGFGSLDCDRQLPAFNDLYQRMYESVAGLPFKMSDEETRDYSMMSVVNEDLSVGQSIKVSLKTPWQVLDRIGYAIQCVASDYKHDSDKAVLGLPRKIHGPLNKPMRHQEGKKWNVPLQLAGDDRSIKRFTAPLSVHLQKDEFGYTVNLLTFPSSKVRDYETSSSLLAEVQDRILDVLSRWKC